MENIKKILSLVVLSIIFTACSSTGAKTSKAPGDIYAQDSIHDRTDKTFNK